MEASVVVFLDRLSPQIQSTDCHSQQFPAPTVGKRQHRKFVIILVYQSTK